MPRYKIYHFKSLTSTQDKAKEFAKKGLSDIVIVADVQTRGRGRFKRKWHSSKNGLWVSILLKTNNVSKLPYITFIAAIAVVRSIKKIANLSTKIKWPNDVHYKSRKLCGILTEGVFGRNNFVIVGIGLNVNQTKFPNEIKNIATSLKMITKKSMSIRKIMNDIIDEFFGLYHNYYNNNKFNKIQKIWKKHSDTINKEVTIITRIKKINGKVIGIDEDCNLLLALKNKKTIKITEGDIMARY